MSGSSCSDTNDDAESTDRRGRSSALKAVSEHVNQRISMRACNALYSAVVVDFDRAGAPSGLPLVSSGLSRDLAVRATAGGLG
jgi:hypothetical protein